MEKQKELLLARANKEIKSCEWMKVTGDTGLFGEIQDFISLHNLSLVQKISGRFDFIPNIGTK